MHAGQLLKEQGDLAFGKDCGQMFGWFGAQGIDRPNFLVQDMPIEEEECREGLVLGRGGHLLFHSQMS